MNGAPEEVPRRDLPLEQKTGAESYDSAPVFLSQRLRRTPTCATDTVPPSGGDIKRDRAFAETASLSAPRRRVVLDTNVLVSLYVFADSRFAQLRARIESGEWQALTNDACFNEFRRVLAYPMFALAEAGQRRALDAYDKSVTRLAGCESRQTAIASLPRCRDPDDQKFLELARDGAADWLVTDDKALLRLARRERLRGMFRILTPEMALTELGVVIARATG